MNDFTHILDVTTNAIASLTAAEVAVVEFEVKHHTADKIATVKIRVESADMANACRTLGARSYRAEEFWYVASPTPEIEIRAWHYTPAPKVTPPPVPVFEVAE